MPQGAARSGGRARFRAADAVLCGSQAAAASAKAIQGADDAIDAETRRYQVPAFQATEDAVAAVSGAEPGGVAGDDAVVVAVAAHLRACGEQLDRGVKAEVSAFAARG